MRVSGESKTHKTLKPKSSKAVGFDTGTGKCHQMTGGEAGQRVEAENGGRISRGFGSLWQAAKADLPVPVAASKTQN